jgi:hypothetical protein
LASARERVSEENLHKLRLFLCLLLRDWKLEIVLKDGETELEYEKRVLGKASLVGTAFGLGSVPIRLSKRR